MGQTTRLGWPHRTIPEMWPDNLQQIAMISGFAAAKPDRCRVLDIGCGVGLSIREAARRWPGSEFVGLDINAEAIGLAAEDAAGRHVANVRFVAADVRAAPGDLGLFDYVTASGIYTAVTSDVQTAILDLIGRCLAPAGVACVGYSTLPGWHMHQVTRDLGTRFARQDPGRLRRLLEFANRRSGAALDGRARRPLCGELYARESERLRDAPDSYVDSEYLAGEPHNPLYFLDFLERAARVELVYVGDACASAMMQRQPDGFRAEVKQLAGDDRLQQEQLLDFVIGRTWRQTLLARV